MYMSENKALIAIAYIRTLRNSPTPAKFSSSDHQIVINIAHSKYKILLQYCQRGVVRASNQNIHFVLFFIEWTGTRLCMHIIK